MNARLLSAGAVSLALLAAACGKDSRADGRPASSTASGPSGGADCPHAACGHDFFVDAAPGGPCAVGATCTVTVTLVATGAFHINDAYPYKLKADEARGVEFLGTGADGKNVFSTTTSDWQKRDEKTGTLTIRFRPDTVGVKTIGGVFKLSVCSAQSCQLEQQPVSTNVTVK